MKKTKGFTLIELLVVTAIIGLLVTLSLVAFNSARIKALTVECEKGDRQACTDLKEKFDIDLKPGKKIKVDCEGEKFDCRYLCTTATGVMDSCLMKCDIVYDKCDYYESH